MNPKDDRLEDLVRSFALQWATLDDPATGEHLLADPVLVLGPEGVAPVARPAFLAAVVARARAAEAAPAPTTTLADVTAHALGDRMVLATLSWTFSHATTSVTLVSDFLLQRDEPDQLRCVAYLPRTNVLDHLP